MATVNDIVLIHLEESPVSFARIENIQPDAKKDWYHIKLLMLQIPLQVVTWILKEEYINGEEFFMNGKQMRLKKVECPVESYTGPTDPSPSLNLERQGKTKDENLSKTSKPSAPMAPAKSGENSKIITFPGAKTDK